MPVKTIGGYHALTPLLFLYTINTMTTARKLLFIGIFFVLGLLTALTISSLKKPQEIRTRAANGTTTLSLIPASSAKKIGDTIALDVMVDPGQNLVSFVKLQLKYDPTKITLVSNNPFTINAAAFPIKMEGPVMTADTIGESVSVGADGTRVIQTKTKVGTINFRATGATGNTPTTVTFTDLTQALSIGGQDNSYQSVLDSTSPASITISGTTQVTPTIVSDPCEAFDTCPTISATQAPTTTPNPTTTRLTTASLTVLLHGIGATGDNPNPGGASLSNKKPLHPQRNLEVLLFDTENKRVASVLGKMNYDASSGSFKGKVDLGSGIKTGKYSMKIKTDGYLRKLAPGALTITTGRDNTIPKTALVAGDTNGDNSLNILDYNALLDCGYGALSPLPLADANSIFNKKPCKAHTPQTNIDVEDNGIVNSFDYNLFLRELSVQNGD